jgi:hypothetical protein
VQDYLESKWKKPSEIWGFFLAILYNLCYYISVGDLNERFEWNEFYQCFSGW